MKRPLVLVSVLLLCTGAAWADDTATDLAVPAPAPAADAPAPDLLEGGGCMLPDLAGLSEREAKAAAIEAGFDVSSQVDAALPACPQRFSCSSITNCGIGQLCSLADIGPCCDAGGGLGLCCISGSIKVQRCPCRCTGNPCAFSCVNSTDVRWNCS